MTLYLNSSGTLITKSGSLGAHANCCCETPCLCSTSRSFVSCDCMSADYTKVSAGVGDLQVTISGTMTSYPYYVGGVQRCSAPASCPSLTGTYVVPCSTPNYETCPYVFVCVYGGDNIYYTVRLRIEYTQQTNHYRAIVRLNSRSVATTGTDPTGSCAILYKSRTIEFRTTAATFDDWQFEPSTACRAECNDTTPRRACYTGSIPLYSDSGPSSPPVSPPQNHCNVDDLVITASIA